jgi:hypothetical protein
MTQAPNISTLTARMWSPKQEVMPTDMCIYFYECTGCKRSLGRCPAIAASFALTDPTTARRGY